MEKNSRICGHCYQLFIYAKVTTITIRVITVAETAVATLNNNNNCNKTHMQWMDGWMKLMTMKQTNKQTIPNQKSGKPGNLPVMPVIHTTNQVSRTARAVHLVSH